VAPDWGETHQGEPDQDTGAHDAMRDAVSVRDLRKVYAVAAREAGLGAAVRDLVRRRTRSVEAVAGVSFTIRPGEVVGFLGPNGAGKTTTLKVLTGLLYPTSGEARVLGFVPHRRQRDFLSRIALVMGNRNQLTWDLPVADSFEVHRVLYDVPDDAFRRARGELVDLLELAPLLPKPVRQLSLGERMRCELAVSLLHAPRILFLDEPTIGLDVVAQRRIRTFLGEYNRRSRATVLLTSHYMADVEALCARVIVIHHGRLLFDGTLSTLRRRFATHKTVQVQLAEDLHVSPAQVDAFTSTGTAAEVLSAAPGRLVLRVPADHAAALIARLVGVVPVQDISVTESPIEEVIERVFAGADASADAGADAAHPEIAWGAPDREANHA
jgi:ABC-2 type transport system ATP-binding protein